MPIIPIHLLPVEVRRVKRADDMIVLGDILDALADFDDDARGVGAGDYVVLCWEWVEGEGHADVAVV
jgi:hypothetical protein